MIPESSPTRPSSTARRGPRNGRRSRPTTSRCCNIPAAPPACRRARCCPTAISPRRCRSTTSGARPARDERGDAIERVICVLPLFHIFALTVVMLSCLRRGHLISLHQRFDVESVMRDIEVKRATGFPGVPTMWIAIAALPDLDKRDFSSLRTAGSGGAPLPVEVAAIFERKVGMKLRSGWGMTETCPAGTAHPGQRTGQARLGRRGLARHRDGRGVARRSHEGAEGRRDRRDPHPRTERHARLLEQAGGDRAGVRRRPLPHRRHRLSRRGRLLLPGRPQEGHDHLRRLQRLSADDRAGDLHASVGVRGDRDRHSRRLSRRGGEGLHHAAPRRQAVLARRAARLPDRQARQARAAGRAGIRQRAAAHAGRQAVAPRVAERASNRR